MQTIFLLIVIFVSFAESGRADAHYLRQRGSGDPRELTNTLVCPITGEKMVKFNYHLEVSIKESAYLKCTNASGSQEDIDAEINSLMENFLDVVYQDDEEAGSPSFVLLDNTICPQQRRDRRRLQFGYIYVGAKCDIMICWGDNGDARQRQLASFTHDIIPGLQAKFSTLMAKELDEMSPGCMPSKLVKIQFTKVDSQGGTCL
mmetsp:Transcript_23940/g.39599  ORF Transcript_23940/g.39599 Transcript_23940/m.39599 type:complete len:203 (-) Transcript_23940:62-670(-)|eukprot:CAMPEP_0119007662 /NCGR_PEP_ID=MMETSP1176-20130426/3166_1 /TAXON_ID=265551 /ORGANISM="Synedropsis recta cf, Strain CCMP1620" /LENGTH=202 /DNA_ID=CAMNT_0006959855 /DNA_START=49 /DNA_END=657 /DNA_ORIENTATION=-